MNDDLFHTDSLSAMATNRHWALRVDAVLQECARAAGDHDYPPLDALRAARDALDEQILHDAIATGVMLGAGRGAWSQAAADAFRSLARSTALRRAAKSPAGWWPREVSHEVACRLSSGLRAIMADPLIVRELRFLDGGEQ